MIDRIPEIILDVGVNYYDVALKHSVTPLEAAKLMIFEAGKVGANTVKFQTYKADKLAAIDSPAYWDLKEEPTKTQRELFSKYDHFSYSDYEKLANYCESLNIEFMTTAFDLESAFMIDALVKRHKIASADITNCELLKAIGSYGKPVLLSTGASRPDEIKKAVDLLNSSGAASIILLHCVLNYPTEPSQANLWRISALRNEFPELGVGYSDHTKFNRDILAAAYLLGAVVIEKHYTLDKSLKGNDHYHAAEPEDIKDLITMYDALSEIIGVSITDWFGSAEIKARLYARRGVYLKRAVSAGEVVLNADAAFLRPQMEGVTPFQWEAFVIKGSRYNRDLQEGELVLKAYVD